MFKRTGESKEKEKEKEMKERGDALIKEHRKIKRVVWK